MLNHRETAFRNMKNLPSRNTSSSLITFLRYLLPAIGGLLWSVAPARAEASVEFSAETRFQLDLHVPDDRVNAQAALDALVAKR